MAVSTSQDFNLDIDFIIQEAFERLGGAPITGEEAASARRTLNLILADWQNKGVLLWTTELKTQTLVSTTATYDLGTSVTDILQAVIRRTVNSVSTDIEMTRITKEAFQQIPNKATKGKPIQYAIHRKREQPSIVVWPFPENSTDEVRMWAVRRFFNFDNSSDDPDVPYRFLPPLCAGLAYHMSMKRTGIPPTTIQLLKQEYDVSFGAAMEEDRQRADLFIKPRIRVY